MHYTVRACALGQVLVAATPNGIAAVLLGDDKSGLIITRPEVMHDLALKILMQMDDSNDEKQEG